MDSNLFMQSHLCSSLGPLESRDLGGHGIRLVSVTFDCTVHTCIIVAIPARTRCVLTFSCSHTYAQHWGHWNRMTLVGVAFDGERHIWLCIIVTIPARTSCVQTFHAVTPLLLVGVIGVMWAWESNCDINLHGLKRWVVAIISCARISN